MSEAQDGMKQFEDFRLDTSNECLWREGKPIELPPKPFAVLRYLVEHPGRLITHDELLEALWPETYVQPQVLRTYMLDLRKALGDDAGQPRFIQTIPKRGYRFVASVTELRETTETKFGASPAGNTALVEARPRIVNREEEIACLKSQFELAASGQRQMVFVTGEAGIGKTSLVDAFCELMNSSVDAISARGQCVEGFGGKEEYYPVSEALAQLCTAPGGDKACHVLARMAPAWLAAIGREAKDFPEAALPPIRERMPGDLCAALEELASEKPLILVLEDLQWADDSTLHLISALARRRAQTKLLLIATYRAQDLVTEHPLKSLKQDLRLRRLCTEIALAPLGKNAVKELLIRELEQEDLPQGLAGFVHRRSEGNPLFVIAILEHLTAQGLLTREEVLGQGKWVQKAGAEELEAGIPDGLAQMIELEVAHLSDQDQRILEAGSLISVAFPAWAVAAALQMDPAEAEEACDELAKRLYFVDRAGQDELPDGTLSTFYVFAHGLYREVLWRKQTEARRAKRHIRIAERLAELFVGREGTVAREMAMHFESAGSWKRALTALETAAHHAIERKSHAEAEELLEHALRLAGNLREVEREAVTRDLSDDLARLRETMVLTSALN